MTQNWLLRGALLVGASSLVACSASSSRANAPRASAVSRAEVEQAKRDIAPLVDRSAATREFSKTDRAEVAHFRSGNAQVVMTRKNQDGTITTGCVDSVSSAETFLTQKAPTRWEAR